MIDDGSDDETCREAESIQDCHPKYSIKVFKPRLNKGKTAALNYLLMRIKSELIVTLDADTVFASKHSLDTLLAPLIHQKRCSGTTVNLRVRHPN